MLLFSSQECCWTSQGMSLLQQGEREEITVINHPERVWTPEVELEIAVCTLSILWELLSSRLQIKVILNHSARHWGGG